MKHRILSDPPQEAGPAVASLCLLYWAQGLFYPEEEWAWTINSSSHSRPHKQLRILYSLVGCCAVLVLNPRAWPVLITKSHPQH